MTSRRTALVLGFLAVLAAGLLAILMLLSYPTKRNRYLIPEGYAGWLCVTFEAPNAPPLPREDGFNVVRFPLDGRLVTSTAVEGGKLRDEFHYYSGDRRLPFDAGQSLGGGSTSSGGANPPGLTYKFWVSRDARADYARYVENKPDACGPFPGYTSSNKSVNADVLSASSARLQSAGYLRR